MKAFLLMGAVAVAGCKGDRKPAAGFAGAGPVASCDYRAETVDGDMHSCTDVLDAALVASQEKFCNELAGPKDHPTFARGKACPADGRLGGCVEANGTVRWTYKGDETCGMGLKFKGGTVPKLGAPAPYRCANENVCIEEHSVVDLSTSMKPNCEAVGATFAAGPCPTEKVVARCTLQSRGGDSVRSYYAPGVKLEGAKEDCDAAEGTFAAPAAP